MIAFGALAASAWLPAAADTLDGALIQAYRNNPQLNAQRASARATDEALSIALGGYRPRITGTATVTQQHLEVLQRPTQTNNVTPAGTINRTINFANTSCNPASSSTFNTLVGGGSTACGDATVQAYGITATQTLFNGFQTGNRTRQAESQVSAARELLRTTEQTVLLAAVLKGVFDSGVSSAI